MFLTYMLTISFIIKLKHAIPISTRFQTYLPHTYTYSHMTNFARPNLMERVQNSMTHYDRFGESPIIKPNQLQDFSFVFDNCR